ncbi:hypothetical protein POM88_022984 [Heracleum sosnowskyi]|uniref:Uncharacterized protein n=1 Tax=Heracleum sosnowskyi TaxID=360622 RepID=A0AAD8MU67_9APIA|nr:hypothetical protein POM88_022984 [Heracleum sosnowskyi]
MGRKSLILETDDAAALEKVLQPDPRYKYWALIGVVNQRMNDKWENLQLGYIAPSANGAAAALVDHYLDNEMDFGEMTECPDAVRVIVEEEKWRRGLALALSFNEIFKFDMLYGNTASVEYRDKSNCLWGRYVVSSSEFLFLFVLTMNGLLRRLIVNVLPNFGAGFEFVLNVTTSPDSYGVGTDLVELRDSVSIGISSVLVLVRMRLSLVEEGSKVIRSLVTPSMRTELDAPFLRGYFSIMSIVAPCSSFGWITSGIAASCLFGDILEIFPGVNSLLWLGDEVLEACLVGLVSLRQRAMECHLLENNQSRRIKHIVALSIDLSSFPWVGRSVKRRWS